MGLRYNGAGKALQRIPQTFGRSWMTRPSDRRLNVAFSKSDSGPSVSLTVGHLVVFGLGSTAPSTAVGQIQFDDPVTYSGMGECSGHVTADLDADGDADLIVLGSHSAFLHFNQGDGTMLREASIPMQPMMTGGKIAAGDLDGDGDVDLVWNEFTDRSYYYYYLKYSMRVWLNDGSGRNGEVQTTVIDHGTKGGLELLDLTGDGRKDILLGYPINNLTAMINRGAQGFEVRTIYNNQEGGELTSLTVGDFDGDSDLDVAAAFQTIFYAEVKNSNLQLLFNDGAGTMTLGAVLYLPEWDSQQLTANSMACGDLDGDGDLDLTLGVNNTFTSSRPMMVVNAENDRGERFNLMPSRPAGMVAGGGVELTDIDLNGRLDIVCVGLANADIRVLENLGRFAFGDVLIFDSALSHGRSVSPADLTMDGRHDLAVVAESGLAVLANETPLIGPRYNHSALVRGQEATFVVANAEPGEEAWFLYSRVGVGNSLGYSVLGGMTIDLMERFEIFGVATVQQNGRAVLRRTIPLNAEPGPIATQAVIRRGSGGIDSVKTPFRTAVIAP